MLLQCQGSLIKALYNEALSGIALNEHLVILCVLNLFHITEAMNNLSTLNDYVRPLGVSRVQRQGGDYGL